MERCTYNALLPDGKRNATRYLCERVKIFPNFSRPSCHLQKKKIIAKNNRNDLKEDTNDYDFLRAEGRIYNSKIRKPWKDAPILPDEKKNATWYLCERVKIFPNFSRPSCHLQKKNYCKEQPQRFERRYEWNELATLAWFWFPSGRRKSL